MKHLIRTFIFSVIAAAASLAAAPAVAQTQPGGALINGTGIVDGCRPLLAPDCVVDDIVEEVSVLGDKPDYSGVLDANLTNYATLPSLAKVSALHDVIISIRDLKHKYKGGQKVGFVIGGDGSLLNLSVLEGLSIMFFNDNVQVGDAISISADNFSVVSLNLLSTSGSRTISVDAPDGITFDEIMLCSSGVADISALSNMNVFYGFVGGVETKLQNQVGENTYTSEHTPYSGVIGPIYGWKEDDFADGDTYNPLSEFSLTDLVVNAGFGLRITKNDGYGPDNVEIGFTYKSTKILDASLLNNIYIKLEDTSNPSEEEVEGVNKFTLKQSILDLDALGSVEARYSAFIPKGVKWNRVTLRFAGASLLNVLKDTEVYYAYIKKFDIPEEAERCDLNLSADALICASEPSYTLTSDKVVTWALTEAKDHDGADITNHGITIDPAGATKSATVNFNQSPEGVYTFTATHLHGDGTKCTGTVAITRGKTDGMLTATANAFCGTPLDAAADKVEIGKGDGGGLIVIDGLENADNIIDGDLTSYASYARGLQIADNTCIVKVSKTDGSMFDEDQAAVVGFVAETPAQVLGANVLTFYRIVLYNNGEEVYSSVTGGNNAVNVSLVGAPGSGMVRYAITVPDDRRGKFDGFALYTSGLLNLDVTNETMKIYNAFTADEDCSVMPAGPLDHAGVKAISIDDGAKINYKYTGQRGLASVVSVTEGLGYLVDNELTADGGAEQGVTAYTVAGVLNDFGLAVKTGRRYGGGRWVGLVMKKAPGVADVGVLTDMEISLYDNNISTGDEENAGIQLLSTNVIGWGDYSYITVYTDKEFDEVRFKKGQLVEALSGLEYLGFYTYADADGDGIPDEEDPDFCGDDTDIEFDEPEMAGDINGICASNPGVRFTATVTAKDAGKVIYTITDIDRENEVSSGTLEAPADGGVFVKEIALNDPELGLLDEDGVPVYGRYEFKVVVPEKPLLAPARKTFIIHAVRTTWAPQIEVDEESTAAEGGEDDAALYKYSTDWNKWENWTHGVPVIGCTDVVIPSGSKSYPILGVYNGETVTKPTDFNSCDTIHFMHGGEVLGTELLDYKYASVDLELASGRYYMLSTPLKATYAGDFFVPAGMNGSQGNDLFVKLDEETSPENRFSPRVYQRLWMQSAPVVDKVESGDISNDGDVTGQTTQVNYDETRWTPPFNGLTQEYGVKIPAGAYSLGEDASIELYNPAGDDHTSYTPGGFSLMADAEDLAVTTLKFRLPKEHTKYYYYNEKNQKTDLYETISRGRDAGRLITDDLNNKEDWSFNVNITLNDESDYFLVGNPFMAHINIEKFFEDNSGITEVKVYDGNALNSAILCDGEGLLTNNNTDKKDWTSIAPMQSFFVKAASQATSYTITFTKDMLETQPESAQPLRVSQSRAAETDADRIVIKARVGGVESSAVVRFSGGASAGFVPGEDASLLVDNEVRPRVQVFTLAGDRAADIQQTPDVDRLTLGLMVAGGEPLTLSLSGDDDWTLYDTQTGATYPMAGGAEASLGAVGSSTGRFMLVRSTTAIGGNVVPALGVTVSRTPQGTITVTSADGTAIKSCAVYSTDGTLTDSADGHSDRYELRAAQGVSIVTVTKADGTSYTQKIY